MADPRMTERRIPSKDYTSVTEVAGAGATKEQLERLYHRYAIAAKHAKGKRVLEVACGAGLGLGYVARAARMSVGGDYTHSLLQRARSHYGNRIPLLRMDAHYLPFRDGSFDFVFMCEAIYYLARAERFVSEARRVLSPGGCVLVGTVNKDWSEFAPSSFSTRYFSVPELREAFRAEGFGQIQFFGAFPAHSDTIGQVCISVVRRLAVSLNLMPKTLESRAFLKRLFYGSLNPLKPEVEDGMAELKPLVEIPADVPNRDYKIIYALASL